MLLCGSNAGAAGRSEVGPMTVRAALAELRGRPSLDATVTGLVRRGETVDAVRSSSDRRWIEVEIGAGELAWIEAASVRPGAVKLEPQRRAPDEPRAVPEPPRQSKAEPRAVPVPAPAQTRQGRAEPHTVPAPAPSHQAKAEPREQAPPPRAEREGAHDVRAASPPLPPPKREVTGPTPPERPATRERPPAKPGELFAADLDDERPPAHPGETSQRVKR
jgi:hypothetical protein